MAADDDKQKPLGAWTGAEGCNSCCREQAEAKAQRDRGVLQVWVRPGGLVKLP